MLFFWWEKKLETKNVIFLVRKKLERKNVIFLVRKKFERKNVIFGEKKKWREKKLERNKIGEKRNWWEKTFPHGSWKLKFLKFQKPIFEDSEKVYVMKFLMNWKS